MPRRTTWRRPDPDPITLARLDGTTTRHVHLKSADDVAIAELREIATQVRQKYGKPELRVDLLSHAAGMMLGKWQADPVVGWVGERGAQLLVAAGGTDEEIGRAAAADLIRRSSRPHQ
jgi:hypothetical protein